MSNWRVPLSQGVIGAHDVDARTEAAARNGEAGSVPELGEHLLELGVQALAYCAVSTEVASGR